MTYSLEDLVEDRFGIDKVPRFEEICAHYEPHRALLEGRAAATGLLSGAGLGRKLWAGLPEPPDLPEDELELTAYPKCPLCGFEDQDWWDGQRSMNDGDSGTFSCSRCDASFEATIYVTVEFTTRGRDGK